VFPSLTRTLLGPDESGQPEQARESERIAVVVPVRSRPEIRTGASQDLARMDVEDFTSPNIPTAGVAAGRWYHEYA